RLEPWPHPRNNQGPRPRRPNDRHLHERQPPVAQRDAEDDGWWREGLGYPLRRTVERRQGHRVTGRRPPAAPLPLTRTAFARPHLRRDRDDDGPLPDPAQRRRSRDPRRPPNRWKRLDALPGWPDRNVTHPYLLLLCRQQPAGRPRSQLEAPPLGGRPRALRP